MENVIAKHKYVNFKAFCTEMTFSHKLFEVFLWSMAKAGPEGCLREPFYEREGH